MAFFTTSPSRGTPAPGDGGQADENTPLLGETPLIGDVVGGLAEPDLSEGSLMSSTVTEDEVPKGDREGSSPLVIVLVLVMGVFIGQMDGSFVLATHSNIASEFQQLSNSGWLLTSYSLVGAATQPIIGKLSDIYGRRQCLLTSYAIFATGTLLSGILPTFAGVIFGRSIAGIGGAGLNSLVALIVLDLVPLREVATLRSYMNIASTTGRSLGGPLGGIFADTIGWRWSFVAQVPLLLISALLAWRLVPSHPLHHHTRASAPPQAVQLTAKEKLARIDFAGAALLAATITTLLLALEIAGKMSWTSPLVLGLLGGGLVLGAAFATVETWYTTEPVFPLFLLRDRAVVSAYGTLGTAVAAQICLMYCVPIYFQVTQNASAALAGTHLFPAVAGNAVGALISGLTIKRTGRYKALAIIATISSSISYSLLMLRWRGHTGFWESLYIVPGGFGLGICEAAVFISLSASVPKALQGVALSGLFLTVSVGVLTGYAASSSVLENVLRSELVRRLVGFEGADEIIRNSVSDIGYVKGLTGPIHDAVVASYVRALEWTHAVSLVCMAIAFAASLAIPQKRL
ncbi:MFS general substrate transporter [Trichodelitschia bisporula]|uniref:MFS general substrate transporter n=1 Tax=Trichodelitschia bisporula TaxID=703511 RepID=A0A6G1I3V0_9PEZI|nr:MFS general substrate transporter [Trichodelitschia bisporula]